MRLDFHRGTIVLRDPPALLDLGRLPGVAWDSRVGLHRAPAMRYAEIARALTQLGVRYTDTVPDTGHPPASFQPIALRPYQEAALDAWEAADQRGVVVLPTGSGKTRVALAALARSGRTALCLVPTRVLLDQWLGELSRVYPGPLGRYGDGHRDLCAITVATFESAFHHMERLGDRFDLLIVDEVHHFGVGLRDEALEMSIARARLGLTATPPRGDAAARVAELVGPTVYELSIADLAGTFLADLDLLTLHLDLTIDERGGYERRMAEFRPVRTRLMALLPRPCRWDDFARAASRSPEGRRALAALAEARRMLMYTHEKRAMLARLLDRHAGARVLVFCADNRAAYDIARAHLVMPLTCDIGRAERDEALARFRGGELLTLVSARVLNEGIDVPDAEVAIVVAGALGEREHVQRVGRILRPKPGKRALVYELVTRDTLEVRQSQRRREGLAPRSAAPL